MTESFMTAATPYKESAADRVSSLRLRLEQIKVAIGEVENDIEKCTDKHWLDMKTLKRLDKAVTVMKVGYKIAKRGMNRDKKFGDDAMHDAPDIPEDEMRRAQSAITDAASDRTS